MMKKLVLIVTFCCAITGMLAAANLLDLAAMQRQVGIDAFAEAGNGVYLAKGESSLVVAYKGNDGSIRISRQDAAGRWTSTPIATIPRGFVQGLAAKDSLVVVGYSDGGQSFTLSSNDGGQTFSQPVPVIPTRQGASIQDMVIDASGTIHIVFHRHDGYWDYNYARSTDGGKSYRTFLDFTKASDSNSTGYAGHLRAAHGNLYTVYQDNNDEFATKLAVSRDQGSSWTVTRLAPSTNGRLGLAVDPVDPDLLYVIAFNDHGLTVLRVTEATSASPKPWPVYGDGNIKPNASAVVSANIAIANDRTVAAVYLNPITGSYGLLSSTDQGDTWERGILTTSMTPTTFLWGSDLESYDNEFYFACFDGKGSVLLHGPERGAAPGSTGSAGAYTPDAQGLVELPSIEEPFSVVLNTGMPFVMFSVSADAPYTVRHLTQDMIPLYLALYDLYAGGDTVLAENYDGVTVHDRLSYGMDDEAVYLLALGVLDDTTLGQTVRIEISRDVPADPKPVVPATAPAKSQKAKQAHSVSAGYFTSFALNASGQLFGAGLNSYGQMTDGSTGNKISFGPLRAGVSFLSSGFGHTLIMGDDHILYAAGRNDDFQIGDGSNANRLSLFRLADNVVSAAAGYGHSLYVQADGSVWGVGANSRGQLGDGTTIQRSKPVKVFEHGAQVVTNFNHTSFIITPEGDLYGFGENSDGQLGLGHTGSVTKPTYILDKVTAVAAGMNHTLILRHDGTVWAAGTNAQGQLGTGSQTAANRFVQVASEAVDIAAGQYHSLVVGMDGVLRVAGSNKYGQYGTGDTKNRSLSSGFVSVLEGVVDADAGRDHSIALKRDGSVWTAGLNEQYQLGDQSQGFRREWKQVFSF